MPDPGVSVAPADYDEQVASRSCEVVAAAVENRAKEVTACLLRLIYRHLSQLNIVWPVHLADADCMPLCT